MVWQAAIMAAGQVAGKAVDSNVAREKAAFESVFDTGSGMKNAPDYRTTEAVFDNSGWNVSFGSSRITSSAEKETNLKGADGSGSGLSSGLGGMLAGMDQGTMLLIAGLGLAVLIAIKKRKAG